MKINKEHVAYLEENYGKNILPLSIFENEAMIGKGPNEMIFFYKKKAPILKHKENLLM